MDYVFQHIESLIRNAIKAPTDIKSKEQHDQTLSSIIEESSLVKGTFSLKALTVEPLHLRSFIRYHQQAIINLLNDCEKVGRTQRREFSMHEIIKSACIELEDLLRLIQDDFQGHFDLDVRVPNIVREKALLAIKESSVLLESSLPKGEIEPALSSMCLVLINNFLREDELKLTYRRLKWIREFITELLQLSDGNIEGQSINNEIRSILIQINYNHTPYLKYCIESISNKLSSAETLTEKLEQLASQYKVINQSIIKPNFSFDPDLPSLKERLSDWILEEIHFLERKLQLSMAPSDSAGDQVKKDFKLIFDMSIPQFAYLIRTLAETGVIRNKNVSELARFLAKFVTTKRSENISSESFRISYYDTEDRAKGAVKNLLSAAIGYIDNN